MFHLNSPTRTFLRLTISGLAILLLSAGTAINAVAESAGYISPNSADLPTDLTRDISLRSNDRNRPPAYGPEDAKVLIITFSDYNCPACIRASQSTHIIASEFPGDIRMEFWNHPLPSHKGADLAAAAGIAAQRQGKFWEMNDLLFENHKHDMASLEQNAVELGLNLDQFRADMNDPEVMERIQKESELANALGAPNTPGYVINGRVGQGWGSWNSFRRRVAKELAATNVLEEQGMDPAAIRNQRALDNNVDSEIYELIRVNFLEPEYQSD